MSKVFISKKKKQQQKNKGNRMQPVNSFDDYSQRPDSTKTISWLNIFEGFFICNFTSKIYTDVYYIFYYIISQ